MNLPPVQRFLLALLGALLFFMPTLAAAVGVRVRPIENRPLATRPSISDGWDAIDGVTPFANDHLPLRDRAIRIDSWIDESIFRDDPASGQSSNPKVLLGDAGMLFLADDLDKACNPAVPVQAALSNVIKLHDLLSRYGKRLVFTIIPDKTTIMDDRLRPSPQLECGRFAKTELWHLLAADPPRGFVDVHDGLKTARAKTGEALYRKLDTHWNERGAMLATRAIADALDPTLWESSKVVRVPDTTSEGDLARLLGRFTQEIIPNFELRRDVRRSVLYIQRGKGKNYIEDLHVTNKSQPNTSLMPGKTIFFYDSFGEVLLPFLSTLFADIQGRSHTLSSPETLAQRMATADTVIYEVVERDLVVQFGVKLDWGKILSDMELALSGGAS